MRKLHQLIIVLVALTFSSVSYAEMKFGVSAALTNIEASGTETEGGEKNSKEVSNTAVVPSIFAEIPISDGVSIGLDLIPLSADVSDKTHSRTDTETSVSGTATTTSTSRTQKAAAELSNHLTLYANVMMGDSLYLKGGVAHVTLETNESLGTGSKYADEDVMGYVIGFGLGSGPLRTELLYTDYEDISITSSVARTDVTTNNKIEADLDTLALRVSYAF